MQFWSWKSKLLGMSSNPPCKGLPCLDRSSRCLKNPRMKTLTPSTIPPERMAELQEAAEKAATGSP